MRVPILKLDEVRQERRIEVEHISGVYFLFLGETLQYVGRSVNAFGRVAKHKENGLIPFDACFVLPVENELNCEEVEAAYIHAYRPPHNRHVPKKRGVLSYVPSDATRRKMSDSATRRWAKAA